jgi:hypothetical protein
VIHGRDEPDDVLSDTDGSVRAARAAGNSVAAPTQIVTEIVAAHPTWPRANGVAAAARAAYNEVK